VFLVSPLGPRSASGGLAEAGGGQVLLAERGEVDAEFRVVCRRRLNPDPVWAVEF
jgi:hypothetical protein